MTEFLPILPKKGGEEIINSFKQWCGYSMQFYFQYFFSFYGCFLSPLNCTIDLQLISLDFARFCNFFNVVTNRWTDGPMDRQTNGWMDQWMEQWMYNVSFVYICNRRILKCWFSNRFCHFYKSFTDRQTDRRTDQRTDKPSFTILLISKASPSQGHIYHLHHSQIKK